MQYPFQGWIFDGEIIPKTGFDTGCTRRTNKRTQRLPQGCIFDEILAVIEEMLAVPDMESDCFTSSGLHLRYITQRR